MSQLGKILTSTEKSIGFIIHNYVTVLLSFLISTIFHGLSVIWKLSDCFGVNFLYSLVSTNFPYRAVEQRKGI